jgi:hypothetical protein
MTHLAQTQWNQAYLSGDFGESLARRYFGDELVDAMPRYVRGKRKGLLKGQIRWEKVVRGGWVRTGAYDVDHGPSGYVERRVNKIIAAELSIPQWREDATMIAEWQWPELYMNDRSKAYVIEAERAVCE